LNPRPPEYEAGVLTTRYEEYHISFFSQVLKYVEISGERMSMFYCFAQLFYDLNSNNDGQNENLYEYYECWIDTGVTGSSHDVTLKDVLNTAETEESQPVKFSRFRRITPWDKVLLQKLIVPQLITKFHVFYGTGRFITVFTTAGLWYLS
jgi:hypothetical protein